VSGTGRTPQDVLVQWTANREKAVNDTSGGYRVCYSKTSGFDHTVASCANVPYVSGPTAPTSTVVSLPTRGTWFFKVVAFSSFNTGGNVSSQLTLNVP
jgi:hypothetical protein